jgi:hypothetical protein
MLRDFVHVLLAAVISFLLFFYGIVASLCNDMVAGVGIY